MSVRFSQLLIAVVLALIAYALFRTVSAYQETTDIAELRARGEQIVGRETQRLGDRVAALQSLAALTAMEGYRAATFQRNVRATESTDDAVIAVDFFNADDEHIAHVARGRPVQLGVPVGGITHIVSHPKIQAIELALFDAELSRATSVADLPPKAGAPANSEGADGMFYVATRVVWHEHDAGTIVEFLDARRLLVNDVIAVAPGTFALYDGRGRLLAKSAGPQATLQSTRLNFSIPFGDRVLELALVAPVRGEVQVWWFALGWVALVLAILAPIEVVSLINRRVQALNEELETRVADRTKELEESLEESRRLAAVVESVREGVMRVGPDGIVRYVNAALCAELQLSAADLVHRAVASVPALGLSEAQFTDIRNEVSETGFVYQEMERTRADGVRYIAGVTFTRAGLDSAGGLIAVSRDVTSRRKLVDELLEANDLIERQMRARADFIGTASHELRTPVTTLRMLAALLLEKLGPRDILAADDARLLGVLDQETRRLAHLVDDLLKIARLDSPATTMAKAEVDLRSIASSSMDDVVRLSRDEAQIHLHQGSESVIVRGDVEALRSVATNVIGNAVKFTPASGRIDVTVEADKGRARLVVADTGIGISKDDLPRIFERFYRAPQAAAQASGAGLGLAIVARLVELMQGTITVASELGRGTTVTIEYPQVMASKEAVEVRGGLAESLSELT
jgi:PAS domain S-box-containing protein